MNKKIMTPAVDELFDACSPKKSVTVSLRIYAPLMSCSPYPSVMKLPPCCVTKKPIWKLLKKQEPPQLRSAV